MEKVASMNLLTGFQSETRFFRVFARSPRQHRCATAAFAQLAVWLAETNHSAEACKKFLKGPVRHGGPQRV